MKKLIWSFVLFLILVLAYLAFEIFASKAYAVPTMDKRESTKYWELKTGSKIGYTLIPAKGVKKQEIIIYLEGGPGGFITDSTIASLGKLSEDGYDVYLYDQVGSGHSERLQNIRQYTAKRHKQDLEAIVEHLKAEKVILIGQSWGAILATLYIADNPNMVSKVIFTGPGPIAPFRQDILERKAPDSLDLRQPRFTNKMANDKANNIRTRTASFVATRFGNKLMDDAEADDFQTYLNSELDKSTVVDASKITKSAGGGGYYAQIMTYKSLFSTEDPRPKLKSLNIPSLILKGQYDNQKWGVTSEYLEVFPNHELIVVKNAGHSIETEQPEIYIKSIRDFLRK